MKIGIFSLPQINLGKTNIKDPRLDQVDAITKAKKKTYIQVELVGDNSLQDADAILASPESKADLLLRDLEFVETRLSRATLDSEKTLLEKLKAVLEKEEFIFQAGLSQEEKQAMSSYSTFTNKPVVTAGTDELADLNGVLSRCLKESGFISFFTTGEKETRAWLIKNGITAWEAAGSIHSDIQKGFIRAEIISLEDFLKSGGETQAKQAGKLRLEQKDYLMRDCDLVNFRFNK